MRSSVQCQNTQIKFCRACGKSYLVCYWVAFLTVLYLYTALSGSFCRALSKDKGRYVCPLSFALASRYLQSDYMTQSAPDLLLWIGQPCQVGQTVSNGMFTSREVRLNIVGLSWTPTLVVITLRGAGGWSRLSLVRSCSCRSFSRSVSPSEWVQQE